MGNFHRDIQNQKLERIVKLLQKDGYREVEFAPNKPTAWDLITTKHGNYKLEVKNDVYSSRSGNVFVEYQCREKPSGLTTTEANYWIIQAYSPDGDRCEIYFLPTECLRQVCVGKRVVFGGDEKRSLGYLVPMTALTPWLWKVGVRVFGDDAGVRSE